MRERPIIIALLFGCTPRAVPVSPKPRHDERIRIPTELVSWQDGRERVAMTSSDLDAKLWAARSSGIWFVRPVQRDLDASSLREFVARAVSLGAPGISLAGEAHCVDATLAPIAGATGLMFLDISHTAVTDHVISLVKAARTLAHVWMSSTAITDDGLVDLSALRDVISVRVDDTAITDRGIAALAAMPELRVLSAGSTGITDTGLARAFESGSLRYIAVPHTRVTGRPLLALPASCSLTGIDLAETAVDDKAVDHLLTACRDLAEIDLGHTQITDVHAAGGLGLHRLDLAGTSVRTATLQIVGGLSDLTWLDLSDTNIVAKDLAALSNLVKLEHLGVGHLGVRARGTKALEIVLANTGLTELNLAGADLEDRDVSSLRYLKLRQLDLSSTRIGDGVADVLARYSELRRLGLAHTEVSNRAIEALVTKQLVVLDLTGTHVDAAAVLARFTDLEQLFLSESEIRGDFVGLKSLVNLRVLHVAQLPFDDAAATFFVSMPRLEELDLGGTKVTSTTLGSLQSLRHLRSLGLDALSITDDDLHLLATLHLNVLTLRDSQITDRAGDDIASIATLRQISLEGTAITDTGCARLARGSLQTINLSRTRVTGRCIATLASASVRDLYADDVTIASSDLRGVTSRLETLSIGNEHFDDALVRELARLATLRTIYSRAGAVSAGARKLLANAGITTHP